MPSGPAARPAANRPSGFAPEGLFSFPMSVSGVGCGDCQPPAINFFQRGKARSVGN